MKTRQFIFDRLRVHFKAQQVTLKDIAQTLEVSEQTVKLCLPQFPGHWGKPKGLMTRRMWLEMMMGVIWASGTHAAYAMSSRPTGFGVVVSSGLMQGQQAKYGVDIKSDSGRHLAGFASLRSRNGPGVGQTSGYGGMGLPEWVEVSWRTGNFIQRYDPETKSVWTGGTVIGQRRIDVASRIPEDVLQYASAERGRAIKLMFRLLDDDVVMGWCVQESSKLGGGWLFSHFGGDFKPATWVDGVVAEKGWYLDRKTGQRIETDTGH